MGEINTIIRSPGIYRDRDDFIRLLRLNGATLKTVIKIRCQICNKDLEIGNFIDISIRNINCDCGRHLISYIGNYRG